MRNATKLVGVVLVCLLACVGAARTNASAWFVDNTAAGTASGTSWANAFTHLSQLYAAATAPDDVVYISGGPAGGSQTYGGYLRLSHNGTAGHPITIQRGTDASHNGVVIFDGADGAEGFSYCDMTSRQFIVIDGGSWDSVLGFAFINLYDTGDRTFANKIFADSSYGLTVKYCGFTNVNNGVRIQSAQYTRVSNCSFDNIRGDAAIRGPSCGPDVFDANIIENNIFNLALCTNCPAFVYGPDGVQGSHGLTVRYNQFRIRPVNFYTSTQHPDYCQVIGNHNKFYGNLFVNPGDSCIDLDCYANSTPHDWWVYNNIFQVATNCVSSSAGLSPNPWIFRTYSSSGPTASYTNMKFWNNIFVDCWWNAMEWAWAGTPTLTGIEIKNNIFQNSPPYYIVGTNPNYSPAAMGMATNIYATGGSWLIQGSTFTTNNWGAQEASAIFASPAFTYYAASCYTNNMHLDGTDTVATGKGVDLSAYFTTDYDQAARTAPWDLGPFKSGGSFFAPDTPTNVTPAPGATGVSVTPTLTGSAYSDPNTPPSGQTDAQFQVYASDGVTLIWDSGTGNGAVTSITVGTTLSSTTAYKWQCRYENASLWSSYSTQTSFTTGTAPVVPYALRATTINAGKITYP